MNAEKTLQRVFKVTLLAIGSRQNPSKWVLSTHTLCSFIRLGKKKIIWLFPNLVKVAVHTLSTTNISKKGLGYYKVFRRKGWGTAKKWGGVLTTSIKKGENAQKMQKYV